MSVRRFTISALVGLSTWLILEALHLVELVDGVSPLVLLGFTVPLFAALHHDAYARFGKQTLASPGWAPLVWLLGILVVAVGTVANDAVVAVGAVLWAAAGIPYAIHAMKATPKATLVTDDPLTKGDDACFKHLTFAHRFLPIGLLMLVGATTLAAFDIFVAGLITATLHVLFIGYALISTYGISHLWVPRFSGVPAIAAGAIKGELHTSLLGIVGLVIGFLTGIKGLIAGLGFFAFVGFFTFMGVIGANMMKNKSKTHQVTPEFVYIPWTFTAVFWLISAVLMGLFLNVVPDLFADRLGDLRHLHVMSAIVGGFVQLAIGILTRALPIAAGTNPPRFQGQLRGAFFAFNTGLVLWLAGTFAGSALAPTGIGLVALSLFLVAPLAKLMPGTPMATS